MPPKETPQTLWLLAGLRDHIPGVGKMVWLLGNHEERADEAYGQED